MLRTTAGSTGLLAERPSRAFSCPTGTKRQFRSLRSHAFGFGAPASTPTDDSAVPPAPSFPSMPSFQLPKIEMPKMEMPKMEMPKMEMPKMEMPKMEMPKMEMPKMEMPKMEMPKMEMPKMEMPEMPEMPDRLPTTEETEGFLYYVVTHISISGWVGIIILLALGVAATQVDIKKEDDLPPKEDAILVLGATGRVGRRVVQKLIMSGRNVVALTRSAAKSADVFKSVNIQPGRQKKGNWGILYLETNNDILRKEMLTENPTIWQGVTQVCSIIGPNTNSPEGLEAKAGLAIVESVAKYLSPETRKQSLKDVLTFEDLSGWENTDDINVGGKSTSSFRATSNVPSGKGAVFSGTVYEENGGFVGVRSKRIDIDLSKFDGLALEVLGDGQSYKLNIKTLEQISVRSAVYQTTFDTVAGEWTDVYLPWHSFIKVSAATTDGSSFIDAKKISKIGLGLSRFDFNGSANPMFRPGNFRLEIDGAIKAYKDPRPQILMVSSAGVERSALIGDDEALRAQDPSPIVRSNPANTLTYKFFAEGCIRGSGFPYSVIRLQPLVDESPVGPYEIESSQGDTQVGVIGRDEAADVIMQALNSPESVGKTMEVRRSEATDGKRKAMGKRDWLRFFMKIQPDRIRFRFGLKPQPKMPPPPKALAQDKQAELEAELKRISDLREKSVQAIKEAEQRKKEEEEAAKAAKARK